MKLAGQAVDRFLRNPDPKIGAVLIYGPDTGLVRERADALTQQIAGALADPFRVSELTPAALKDDAARLADEMAALCFGGGRRVVRLREAGDAQAPLLKDLLADPPAPAMLIVEGGDLGARSPLRKVFESSGRAAALPCYRDEGRDLERLVRDHLAEHGLTASSDAMRYLTANLGGDRALTRAELDKLVLYAGGNGGRGEVDLDAAMACVGDTAALSTEDLVFAIADGNPAAADRVLERELQEGASPIMLLRAASRHILRLHLAGALQAEGRSAEEAIAALRPPVFFRYVPRFKGQLERWRGSDLARALDRLTEAESRAKAPGMSGTSEVICRAALLELASGAPR
jgi:DNA polymerase-3 subunit delta